MKIIAITQARMGSTRFPNKIVKKILDKTLLEIHLIRVLKSKKISKVIVAIANEPESKTICEICNDIGVSFYLGSTLNVLERFVKAIANENPDYIVRLTSDCPLIDPVEIDNVINFTIDNKLDYASNSLFPTFPDGLDVEVFTYDALLNAYDNATLNSEKEHVTSYIWKNSTYNNNTIFKSDCYKSNIDYSDFRITVDTFNDFQVIDQLINTIGFDKSWIEYIELIKNNKITLYNKNISRNEGYENSLNKD